MSINWPPWHDNESPNDDSRSIQSIHGCTVRNVKVAAAAVDVNTGLYGEVISPSLPTAGAQEGVVRVAVHDG
jgi:hypothetical protein